MIEFIESIAEENHPPYTEVKEIHKKIHVETSERIEEEILASYTVERYKHHGTSKETLSMVCGSYLTSALINLNLDALDNPKKDEKLHEDVARVENIIRGIHSHSGYPWEEIRNGFFAEAAVAVALKIRGFEIYMPDFTDDTKGKIDLIVYDPGEKIIIPIQVKSSTYLKGVVLDEIREDNKKTILHHVSDNWDHKTQSLDSQKISYAQQKLESLNDSLVLCFDKMIEYLEPAMKYEDYRFHPILIAIPGGDNCEESMFNTRTGAPVGVSNPFDKDSLSDIIYEKLEKIIYPEGDE